MEDDLKSLELHAKCFRGLLYIEIVERLKSEGKAVKGFTELSLNVAYMTVLRNIKLPSLI